MTDSGGLIKFALIGGAAYVAYNYFMTPAVASVPAGAAPPIPPPASTQPAPTPVTPAPPVPPAPPAPNKANVLDGIFSQLKARVGAQKLTADQFNFYLQPLLPTGMTAPDPMAVFPGHDSSFAALYPGVVSGWTRDLPMDLGPYWLFMSPYLQTNLGLSGLGVLGGLGAYMARRGRR